MSCNNSKCKCTNCINDRCNCDDGKICKCFPASGSCCCKN